MRILIGGGGQVAELVSRRLIREGNEITLVEQNPERCAHLDQALGVQVIQGNITSVDTLHKAGLRDAEMLLAITTSEEANLLACLIAQVESNVRVKVARLRQAQHCAFDKASPHRTAGVVRFARLRDSKSCDLNHAHGVVEQL